LKCTPGGRMGQTDLVQSIEGHFPGNMCRVARQQRGTSALA